MADQTERMREAAEQVAAEAPPLGAEQMAVLQRIFADLPQRVRHRQTDQPAA